jgi:hypothetical protein
MVAAMALNPCRSLAPIDSVHSEIDSGIGAHATAIGSQGFWFHNMSYANPIQEDGWPVARVGAAASAGR